MKKYQQDLFQDEILTEYRCNYCFLFTFNSKVISNPAKTNTPETYKIRIHYNIEQQTRFEEATVYFLN